MKTRAIELNVKKFPYREFNKYGYQIYYEDIKGFWWVREYNRYGIEIYYENSKGKIRESIVKKILKIINKKLGY